MPCRCHLVGVAGDEARVREPVQARGTPRAAPAPTSLPEKPVGEGHGGRRMPPGSTRPQPRGQMPEQQRQPHLEARLGGDGTVHVEVGRALTDPPQQRLRDLRPRTRRAPRRRRPGRRSAPSAACRQVQMCSRMLLGRPHATAAADRRRRPARSPSGRRPGHRRRSRRPARGSPVAVPDDREPRVEVALADLRLGHRRRDHLARGQPHAQVEGVGEVVVGVQQEAVRRRELRAAGALGAQRATARDGRAARTPWQSRDVRELRRVRRCGAALPAGFGRVPGSLPQVCEGVVMTITRPRRS